MEDSHFDGLSSLIRLSGASVPARARFIGEAILSSTLSALTLGLVFGQTGAIFMATTGPLVPFLVGSWTGYSFGLVSYWYSVKRMALKYALKYPTILAHALTTERGLEVPPSVMKSALDHKEGENLQKWIVSGGLGRLSLSILAAQSCRNDVEELERQERQRLMEEHHEKTRSIAEY